MRVNTWWGSFFIDCLFAVFGSGTICCGEQVFWLGCFTSPFYCSLNYELNITPIVGGMRSTTKCARCKLAMFLCTSFNHPLRSSDHLWRDYSTHLSVRIVANEVNRFFNLFGTSMLKLYTILCLVKVFYYLMGWEQTTIQ